MLVYHTNRALFCVRAGAFNERAERLPVRVNAQAEGRHGVSLTVLGRYFRLLQRGEMLSAQITRVKSPSGCVFGKIVTPECCTGCRCSF